MDITEHLKLEIERTAQAINREPSTVGRMVGQGGHFYRRLCEGKRVWPETADGVLAQLHQLRSPSSDASEGDSSAMVSCQSKDVGSGNTNVKGATV